MACVCCVYKRVSCQFRVGILPGLGAQSHGESQLGLGLRSQPGFRSSATARIGPLSQRDWTRDKDGQRGRSPQHRIDGRLSQTPGAASGALLETTSVCWVTHSLGVGTVGAEGQGEGRRQDAQLAHHLLHAPQRSLLVRVSKLDHQAGGGTLQGQRQAGRERRVVAKTLGFPAPHQLGPSAQGCRHHGHIATGPRYHSENGSEINIPGPSSDRAVTCVAQVGRPGPGVSIWGTV